MSKHFNAAWCKRKRVAQSSKMILLPPTRLGLIAEHGYWIKPAAAFCMQISRDRAGTGWDLGAESGPQPDSFADNEDWGVTDTTEQHRQTSFGDNRGSTASTPVGHHLYASYRSRAHGSSRQVAGTGPPSPDGMQPTEGAQSAVGSEWIRFTHNADLSWRSQVLAILQNFTRRTPGSFLELKDR